MVHGNFQRKMKTTEKNKDGIVEEWKQRKRGKGTPEKIPKDGNMKTNQGMET